MIARCLAVFASFALCACQASTSSVVADRAARQDSQSVAKTADARELVSDESFVLPGTFSEQTTLADLERRFGKQNVSIVEQHGDEAGRARSVVLFAHDPTRRAQVSFYDDDTLTHLHRITVSDTGSRWRGKRGTHVGMSFAALRERNGKPFYFGGFDGERRGAAQDQWSPSLGDDDATLGALDVEEGDALYFGVELGLRRDAMPLPAGVLPGEGSISSDDARYPRLGELVVVTAISAYSSLDDEW